jgi:hypothetical protein
MGWYQVSPPPRRHPKPGEREWDLGNGKPDAVGLAPPRPAKSATARPGAGPRFTAEELASYFAPLADDEDEEECGEEVDAPAGDDEPFSLWDTPTPGAEPSDQFAGCENAFDFFDPDSTSGQLLCDVFTRCSPADALSDADRHACPSLVAEMDLAPVLLEPPPLSAPAVAERAALASRLQERAGPVLQATVVCGPDQHRKPGYCYLRLIPRRFRQVATKVLGPSPRAQDVAAYLLISVSALGTRSLGGWQLAAAATFEPLHLTAFRPQTWTWRDACAILRAFPDHPLGAPRAAFSGALELLGGTIHKDAVCDAYTGPVLSALAESAAVCPNAIPEPNFSLLRSAGVPVDPNATGSHPHPAMKALEEDMLRTVGHSIRDACTVLFMKTPKFQRLAARHPNFGPLVNPVLTPRDTTRYSGGYAQAIPTLTTPSVFLHDAGHYFSPSDAAALFACNPLVERIFFTALLPDEVLTAEPSWHPSLYRLSPLDDLRYSFVLSESDDVYEQPYSTLQWLRTNSIISGSVSHSVELVESKFAHRFFTVTRAPAPVLRAWHVAPGPDDVLLPDVAGRVIEHSAKRVPRPVFQAVLSHSLSLANQRFESTMAKVRTFIANPQYAHIDMDTWMALAQVCYAMSLSPASLEREAPVNSYAQLLLRRVRRYVNLADGWLPHLTAAVACVSWGLLVLPAVGLPIGAIELGAGVTVPGWAWGAALSALGQLGLSLAGNVFPTALSLPVRAALLAAPHYVSHLPPVTRLPLAVPPAVFGALASLAASALVGWAGASGCHYEVRDFVARMPHRQERRWRLSAVWVTWTPSRSAWWTSGPTPPATAPAPVSPEGEEPPAVPTGREVATFRPGLHDSAETGPSVFAVAAPPTPPFSPSLTATTSLGLSTTDEDLLDLGADDAPGAPIGLDPDSLAAAEHASGMFSSTMRPLRERFGLTAAAVLESDAFTVCAPPHPGGAPMPPANRCLLTALSNLTGFGEEACWRTISPSLPPDEVDGPDVAAHGLSSLALVAFAYAHSVQFEIVGSLPPGMPALIGPREPRHHSLPLPRYVIYYYPGHWSAVPATSLRGAAPPPSLAAVAPLPRGRPSRFEQALLGAKDWTGRPLFDAWRGYDSNPSRAKAYARDLKSGHTGTLQRLEGRGNVPERFTESLDSLVDNHRPRRVRLACIYGAPGSSKSSGVRALLQQSWTREGNHWKLAVPRVALRSEWTASLTLGKLSWKVGTFETNLFKTARTLIVDEISQMPPGYIDLALIKDPTISSVVLIGDVTQGGFHEADVDATLNAGGSEAAYFSPFCHEYRLFSNSIPRAVSNAIGLPTRSTTRGFVRVNARPNPAWPIVCASTGEQTLYSSQGYAAFTFGTVQGQRFANAPVQIVVSNATASLVSRGHFTSAMCRSNVGVVFIMSGNVQAARALNSDPFLAGVFAGGARVRYSDLFQAELFGMQLYTPSGLHDPLAAPEPTGAHIPPGGAYSATMFRGALETELPLSRAPPGLQALLSAPPDHLPDHPKHSITFEAGPPTAAFSESEAYLVESFGECPTREDREEYDYLEQSRQFDDAPWFMRNAHATNLEALFPRHRADDKVTFRRTVEKRLRFASPETNRARYHSRAFAGPLLFDGWCRTTGITPELIPAFNPEVYASCILENEFAKLTKKTQATLMNNADRSDPDWRATFVRIFIKSQLKVKLETLLSPFKAGQTIASFQDSVILVTGPMTRYLNLVAEKLYRPAYYYHPGHSPLAMSSWCREHWKPVPLNSTNDYTAFDQSQTGEALALEVVKCRAFGIPDDVLEYYIELKLHLSSQFGDLAVMRFTGEGPTLLFNSDFNAALVGCQYSFPDDLAVAVAGDDLAINGTPQERPGWAYLRRFLTIVAKPEVCRTAAFCSWYLTPDGVLKEPRVVFAKLLIARERGEEHLVLSNLLAEVAVGYHLGDHVYQHLDELALATHFWLVRYFVTHAPIRFRLLLTTRSLDAVLSRLFEVLDDSTSNRIREISAELGAMWMFDSRPVRVAAHMLTRMGGLKLREFRVFDNLLSSSQRH